MRAFARKNLVKCSPAHEPVPCDPDFRAKVTLFAPRLAGKLDLGARAA
jgi:hypothetical protein